MNEEIQKAETVTANSMLPVAPLPHDDSLESSAVGPQDSKNPRWDNCSPPEVQARQASPLLSTVQQAAQRLNLAPITIRRLIQRKKLRRQPDVRKILISDAELVRFASRTAGLQRGGVLA